MNLVRNALKFTSIDGVINISVCYTDGFLVVNVLDNGTGIATEDFPKLFTRFGKLQRTAQVNSEGIGLGLTMVKQIVESSGGAIGVDSLGINKGSLFSFSMKMDHQVPMFDPTLATHLNNNNQLLSDPLQHMQQAEDELENQEEDERGIS